MRKEKLQLPILIFIASFLCSSAYAQTTTFDFSGNQVDPKMPKGCSLLGEGSDSGLGSSSLCSTVDYSGKITYYQKDSLGNWQVQPETGTVGADNFIDRTNQGMDELDDIIDGFDSKKATASVGDWNNTAVSESSTSFFGDDAVVDQNSCLDGVCQVTINNEKVGTINQDGTGASAVSGSGQLAAMATACGESYSNAEFWCSIENSPITTIVLALVPGFASATGGSDLADSCQKAADMTRNTALISGAVTATCYGMKSACETDCGAEAIKNESAGDKTAGVYANKCSAMSVNIGKMMLSITQGISSMAQAKSCENMVSDNALTACTSADTMSDPTQCPSIACDFNTYPQNQGHPSCPTGIANSGDYTQCAGANAQYNPACAPCFSASPPASCPADVGSGYGGSEFNDALNGDQYDYDGLGNALTDDDFFNTDFNGFDGETASQASLATGGNVGNAGGLGSASGGGGGGGPGGGAAGGADSGIDTDILGRLSGSGGGGGGGGGFAGGYASGAGSAWKKNGRGVGSATQKDKFDLNKLLKDLGGKKSGRTTASLSADQKLSQAGITKANGLSNFQKVTRMINKKRVSLDK